MAVEIPSARGGGASRRWRATVVAACLVAGFLAGAIVASAAMRPPGPPAGVGAPATGAISATVPTSPRGSGGAVIDGFDRPDDPGGLGSVPGGPAWKAVAGSWAIANEQAYSTSLSGDDEAVAVVVASRPLAVAEVRVAQVAPGAGLVFAYAGPGDYWLVEAEPAYGTWNVVHVSRGVARGWGNVGLATTASGTIVSATVGHQAATVGVDGASVATIHDPAIEPTAGAGVAAATSGDASPRFEDFDAAPARG